MLDHEQIDPSTVAQPLLYAAASYGAVKTATMLLRRPDILADWQRENGWTPLSQAARKGFLDIVKLLIDREDVDANKADDFGVTPLMWAVAGCLRVRQSERVTDRIKTLEFLVDRDNVDINQVNVTGDSALFWAAVGYSPPMVRPLINRKDLNVNAVNNYGETALARAALRCDHESMELLLSREDIDADCRNMLGLTPFLLTAGSYHLYGLEAVKVLIHRGDVDVHARDSKGRNALWLAACCGKCLDIIEYLLQFPMQSDGRSMWTPRTTRGLRRWKSRPLTRDLCIIKTFWMRCCDCSIMGNPSPFQGFVSSRRPLTLLAARRTSAMLVHGYTRRPAESMNRTSLPDIHRTYACRSDTGMSRRGGTASSAIARRR
jgi:ankyrin repeat protein